MQQLKWLKENSYHWWTDELDCSKSWSREVVDSSFEDTIILFDNDSERHFADREKYIEICFVTRKAPNRFIWFHLEIEKLDEIRKLLFESS